MRDAALIAGVDEAGRGPLAGPVVAAAVILDPELSIAGVRDSKSLSPEKRERAAAAIRERALAWGVGQATVQEIDRFNILQATWLAMKRAVACLPVRPDHVLVDGNQCPDLPYPVEAVVRGDARVPVISAASIVAKVARDREMLVLDQRYPAYGFARHKGYPTREHLRSLDRYGACPVHRRTFGPVRDVLCRPETAGESR